MLSPCARLDTAQLALILSLTADFGWGTLPISHLAFVTEGFIIEDMVWSKSKVPIAPVDWVILGTRALFMVALPLVAGFYGILSGALIYLLTVWAVFTLLVSLLRVSGWQLPWMEAILAGVEVAFAVVAIVISGGLMSPLWWSLLIGPLRAWLVYSLWMGMAGVGLGFLLEASISVDWSSMSPGVWGALGINAGALLGTAVVMGLLAQRVRRYASRLEREQMMQMNLVREQERARARAVFRMATELNSTLNFERVLDLALDLSARALSDVGSRGGELISALLLFENGRLHIAADRRLSDKDRQSTFKGEKGIIGRSLSTGEPRLSREPAVDPELKDLECVQDSSVVLCIPLSTGYESFGVLLYAHQEPLYFNVERVELLWAVAQQSMIALQNARMYRALKQEKERITEIQDEARKKLARDLHDGPTQTIAAIAMRVNFARRLLDRDLQGASDELFKVEDMARRTTKEIRHMLFTLRPLILESQGLVAALSQLAEKMYETHAQNVMIEASSEAMEGLEMAEQGVVFYIAEEAINNARKHAEAEHIWVRLGHRDELFVMEIEDDGVGFNVGAVDANYEQRGSLGIVNMRERAELVNGMLHIESTEGQGTSIKVYVPLTDESAERLHTPGYAL